MYIQVEGLSLRLPTGGKGKNKRYPDVLAKLTEEAPTGYKDVAISRDGQGHYYASFVHDEKEPSNFDDQGTPDYKILKIADLLNRPNEPLGETSHIFRVIKHGTRNLLNEYISNSRFADAKGSIEKKNHVDKPFCAIA
jgi:hypothetical protein